MPTKIPLHPRRNCWECLFYHPQRKDHSEGLCRLRPPAVTFNLQFEDGTGGSQADTSSWPRVDESDSCGSFQLNHPPEALPAMLNVMRGLGAVDEAHAVCRKQMDEAIDHHVPPLTLECIVDRLHAADLIESVEPREGQPEESHYFVKIADAGASA